jgi:peptidoglycan/LPS O-acetylase OafA/YrhL
VNGTGVRGMGEADHESGAFGSSQRFEVLDGWRGAAAIAVALFHLPVLSHAYGLPVIRNAYLFVDFFFVLSGFVISQAYLDRLSSPADLRRFAIRRFGRAWPCMR